MIKKTSISLKSLGFKKTIIKLIFKLFDYFSFKDYKRKKFKKNLFTIKSVEERFNKIYSTNYWFDNGSCSKNSINCKRARWTISKIDEFKK